MFFKDYYFKELIICEASYPFAVASATARPTIPKMIPRTNRVILVLKDNEILGDNGRFLLIVVMFFCFLENIKFGVFWFIT